MAMYNEEHQEVETIYYQMYSTIPEEWHLILQTLQLVWDPQK